MAERIRDEQRDGKTSGIRATARCSRGEMLGPEAASGPAPAAVESA
jgi:hypothetical protein